MTRPLFTGSPPADLQELVRSLGRNISAARARRGLSEEEIARRAGMTRLTLRKVERGELSTGIGAYVAALWAMGLHAPLATIARIENDPEGAMLLEARTGRQSQDKDRLSDDF